MGQHTPSFNGEFAFPVANWPRRKARFARRFAWVAMGSVLRVCGTHSIHALYAIMHTCTHHMHMHMPIMHIAHAPAHRKPAMTRAHAHMHIHCIAHTHHACTIPKAELVEIMEIVDDLDDSLNHS